MANSEKRPLKVFLCHASGDKPPVRDLYKRLTAEGVDAWLDKEKLLPGQDWRMEIPKAVHEADVVVVCLSNKSITKEGYVQKEIKFALDIAEEKPEGTIFLIPARLEDCVVPERLSRWHWVDLYEENGFIQLLRSMKLRAEAVGAAVEPTSYIDSDKETDRKLEQLYTEGLAAFYTEEWDRACQRFQSILSERPNHKNATEKLDEAKRQRDLSKLYEQASEAVRSGDWETAIHILEELTRKSADYKDAAQLLRNARKQSQLRELYAEAKTLHAAQKWEAVVRVFAQISSVDPNYPDSDGLFPSAQKEVAELKRVANLNDQYSHALREMDSGNWYESRRLLESVHKSQTGFLETEKLLKKVENEIAREEQKRRQNDQVNTLYEQAHGLLRSKKWRNALDKMEEIRKLDDRFPDVDGITEKAQKELAREEQEAERQNRLAALYAEAVRLLKEEKYQEALDKWQEVRAVDPKYPDRQWVGRTAKRKLAGRPQKIAAYEPKPLISGKMGWFILFAVLGFGLARFVTRNLAPILHISAEAELVWILRGLLQGLITALILRWAEKEWKWKVLLTFGTCWAIVYPVVLWTIERPSMLLTVSLVYSLAPFLSVFLASLWMRQTRQWQTYVLIFLGWTLAWVIGQSAQVYLNPAFHGSATRWILCDALAGGIGLWITIDLLKSKFGEKTQETTFDDGKHASGSAKLLLAAFLSVVVLRAIWGFLVDWLNIWQAERPSITQIIFYIVLGGFYGVVVAYFLRKVVPNWRIRQSLVTIVGWALGLVGALLAELVNIDSVAVVMVLCGLSVAVAIVWANPSISPIKLTLIFLCWALSWKYGHMLGEFLKINLAANYAWCFADAVTVLLGLLGTLGIHEYSTDRFVKTTFAAMVGFAAGNFIGTALFINLLRLDDIISVPLALALWGFIGGASFEVPSRNLKKILINGVICAIGFVIGYFAALFFFSRFIDLKNLFWGLGVGIALSLSTRRVSVMALIAILGSAVFMMTTGSVSGIDTGTLWGNAVRGAWIGLVLGFGYAYATRDLKNSKLGW